MVDKGPRARLACRRVGARKTPERGLEVANPTPSTLLLFILHLLKG